MSNIIKLSDLLRDSAYKLTQFKAAQIQALEARITLKETAKSPVAYVNCLVRGKPIKLTPEEIVRQLYVMVLIEDLGYPVSRMELEYGVTFGREKKRADICVFDKDKTTTAYILVELKKPKLKDGKEQLKSYCNASGAPIGVWSNGESISFYHRKDPNYFEDIPAIPSAHQKLSDILTARWTIADLIKMDKLVNQKKSLKDLILEMEDEVLANAGVDVFEELFKLIFTKLYDEMEGGRDPKRTLDFKNYGETETELKAKIQALFEQACAKWEGVFPNGAKIDLTPSHLAVCVASLEGVKLFNSNLDVVDEAFEYLINKSSKGEKGQYFTPRYVIDMCVKMLNPQEHETLIDTAAGSCGFPVHGIFHVWEQIMKSEGLNRSHLFTTEKKPVRCEKYVQEKVFAIDFDEKAVRVGRTLNLIAGDGQTNVLHLNTLDYERWDEKTKDEAWTDIYGEGWKKLRKLRAAKNENRDFEFDILMANPPFAGDIKETRILAKYELGKKNGKYQTSVGRDILFIERNLSFIKAGGRMAIVLPQGRFNNSSDKAIREYLADQCRILGVVGLHGNVFKPHTGTKTSVLLVQKWHDQLCPRVADYPIFFATMREPSKDNSGDKIFVKQQDLQQWQAAQPEFIEETDGIKIAESVDRYQVSPQDLNEFVLDEHEHLVVKHDLFSHALKGGKRTPDGIAEAFIEFAKREGLSFIPCDSLGQISTNMAEVSSIEALKNAGRLDAEYFQPQYEVLYSKIKSTKSYERLGDLLAFNQRGKQPKYSDNGLPVINSKHVRDGSITIDDDNRRAQPENDDLIIRYGDVLINGTGVGTIGRCAVYLLHTPALPDNHVTILRCKTGAVDPIYLAVQLGSTIGKLQVEQRFKGSSGQIELYPTDINEFLIYLAPTPIQKQIKEQVIEAHNARCNAARLLTEAKRAIEAAIEVTHLLPV